MMPAEAVWNSTDRTWHILEDGVLRPTPESRYAELHSRWRPTCPYCRKPRIEDGRGLCRECGAEKTHEVVYQERWFWILAGALPYFMLGSGRW